MAGQRRSGRSSAVRIVWMLSSPSLMPNVSSAKSRSRRRIGRHHEPQRPRDGRLQLAAIDDQIEHAALDQELAALEALGKLLTDRLFDDARAGKPDERLRLGNVEVA